jgi:predicted ATPase
LIGGFLGRVRTAAEVLFLAGEAGVGKSALLDAAVQMASQEDSGFCGLTARSSRPG